MRDMMALHCLMFSSEYFELKLSNLSPTYNEVNPDNLANILAAAIVPANKYTPMPSKRGPTTSAVKPGSL